MLPYILLAISPTIFGSVTKNKNKKVLYALLIGFFIFLLLALRSSAVSNDTSVYFYHFYSAQKLTLSNYLNSSNSEMGFSVYLWIISKLFKNAQWLLVFNSLFCAYSISKFIYNESNDLILSFELFICLGFIDYNIEYMRQAIAMSICLFSYEFVKNKKYVSFFLSVFVACLFHITAVIFVIVILFPFFKISPKYILLYSIFLSVSFVLIDPLINIVNQVMETDYSNVAKNNSGIIATLIYLLIFIFTMLLCRKKASEILNPVEFYILITGFVVWTSRYYGVSIASRMSYYFQFAQIIVLPKIMACSKFTRHSEYITRGIVIALCIILYAYRLNNSTMVPYLFFWQ